MTEHIESWTDWRPARVTGVRSAGCLDHAMVLLEGEIDGEPLSVRVDEMSGRALLGELAGLPSTTAVAADVLAAIVHAAGATIRRVQVTPEGDRGGRILFDTGDRRAGIESIPAGPLLVLATRLAIPIEVAKLRRGPLAESSALPEPFQRLIDELRLGSVRDDQASRNQQM